MIDQVADRPARPPGNLRHAHPGPAAVPRRGHRHPAGQREGRPHLRRPLRQRRDDGAQRRPQLEQPRVRLVGRRQLGLPGRRPGLGHRARADDARERRGHHRRQADARRRRLRRGGPGRSHGHGLDQRAPSTPRSTPTRSRRACSRASRSRATASSSAKKANKRFYGDPSAATILASKTPPPAPAPALVAEVTKLTSGAASRGRRRTGREGNRSGDGPAPDRGQDLPAAGRRAGHGTARHLTRPRMAIAHEHNLNAPPPAARPYGIRATAARARSVHAPRRRRLAEAPLVRDRARTGRGACGHVAAATSIRGAATSPPSSTRKSPRRPEPRQRMRPSSR